jgi:hypothetical protein
MYKQLITLLQFVMIPTWRSSARFFAAISRSSRVASKYYAEGGDSVSQEGEPQSKSPFPNRVAFGLVRLVLFPAQLVELVDARLELPREKNVG